MGYGFESHIASNKAKTFWLIMVFILLMAALGYFGGMFLFGEDISKDPSLMVLPYFLVFICIIIALITTGVSFWFSDTIITKMVNARPVNPQIYIEKYFQDTVEGLVLAAGLPAIPRAFVIESPAMNAFATGRDPEHSIVAVTTGLLEKLDRQELEGVIAHEMSHIYNRDILLMGVAAVIVGGVAMFSNFMLRMMFYGGGGRGRSDNREGGGCGGYGMIIGLIFLILAPIFANLLNMMLSRKREYLADATAVKLTRNPEGLKNALKKISGSTEKMPFVERELSALFIDHPQKQKPRRGFWAELTSTHPHTEDRIAALEDM